MVEIRTCFQYANANLLSCLQIFGNAHIHVTEVLLDVRGGGPFSGLWERIAHIFTRVPDFDERVLRGWVG